MAQVDLPKEASKVKKKKGWSPVLSSNKMIHFRWYFEKMYCLYKYLILEIDPLDSSCPQKLRCPERKLRL